VQPVGSDHQVVGAGRAVGEGYRHAPDLLRQSRRRDTKAHRQRVLDPRVEEFLDLAASDSDVPVGPDPAAQDIHVNGEALVASGVNEAQDGDGSVPGGELGCQAHARGDGVTWPAKSSR
jgi:hypothetical protein